MSVSVAIKQLLEKEGITYQVLEHDLVFTSLEVAQAQHVPGHQMLKTVIVGADGRWVMCVMPATHKIDFDLLKKVLNAKDVSLADEANVAKLFPGFEVGAMPPFGQLAGIPVYVDKSLDENNAVAFNAGTHTDVLKIRYKDFIAVAKPIVAEFTRHI